MRSSLLPQKRLVPRHPRAVAQDVLAHRNAIFCDAFGRLPISGRLVEEGASPELSGTAAASSESEVSLSVPKSLYFIFHLIC